MIPDNIKAIGDEMAIQDNRSTSYVMFVVVEDKKVYGVTNDDYRERKDTDMYTYEDLCEDCNQSQETEGMVPEECDNSDCDESFINYRIEEDVPNLYAGVFFTAKACQAHLDSNRHHYNSTAKVYGISAYHNWEMREVMEFLCPNGNLK